MKIVTIVKQDYITGVVYGTIEISEHNNESKKQQFIEKKQQIENTYKRRYFKQK